MIYFRKIRWKNFLSTGNVFTEIDLASKETTLIVGQNGAGKSTILDALTFGLFGKPFRKINKPQLLNSINQKNLEVEVEFSIGSNEYKIIRGLKPSVFEVYKNDSLLNQSAESKDYQEILETQILKVNYKSFCHVVILGSATFQPFMQLPAAQRREIIEDLLDLQIFSTMNTLLKDKVSSNKEELEEVVSDRKVLESKIEMTKEHIKEVQTNNEKIIEEKKSFIKQSEDLIKEYTEKYNFLKDTIDAIQSEIGDDKSIRTKMEKMSKIRHQLELRIDLLNKEVKFLNEHTNCPTCKQDIDEYFRVKSIEKNKKDIIEKKDGLELLNKEYEELNDRLKEFIKKNDEIHRHEMSKIELRTAISNHSKSIEQLQTEIENLGKVHKENSDNKLIDYENELKEIEVRYNILTEDKNVLSAASVLLKDTGIKSKIVKQYIPVINKFINKYLSAMDFFVSFELDENFNETLKSRYRDEFTYASFSEGEKQKIDLALLFTWRAVAKLRNSINTNLLIMDEIFDSSLDQNSTDYLMNIIREVSKDSNIIVISHKEQMNEKFSNVLKFVKHKSFSEIGA
jgi:DNA repair exonuclease SbcCD ATPase subunit